jgi:hypothetical protein
LPNIHAVTAADLLNALLSHEPWLVAALPQEWHLPFTNFFDAYSAIRYGPWQ